MTVWAYHVEHPNIDFEIYLDDRGLWSNAADPVHAIEDALRRSDEVDRVLNFQANPKKGALWATSRRYRVQLRRLEKRAGPVQRVWKLLGIKYTTTKEARNQVSTALMQKASMRLKRIALATRNRASRKHNVRSLVISMFAWTGSWTHPGKKKLAALTSGVERCVNFTMRPGRGSLNGWQLVLTFTLDTNWI